MARPRKRLLDPENLWFAIPLLLAAVTFVALVAWLAEELPGRLDPLLARVPQPDGEVCTARPLSGGPQVAITNENADRVTELAVLCAPQRRGLVNDLAFTGDGRLLIASKSNPAALADLRSNGLAVLPGTTRSLAVALDRPGGRAALGFPDGRVEVWSLDPPEQVARATVHDGAVNAIVIDRDEGWSFGHDRQVGRWTLDLQDIRSKRLPERSWCGAVDAERVYACGSATITVLDRATLDAAATWKTPSSATWGVALAGDRLLVCGDHDGFGTSAPGPARPFTRVAVPERTGTPRRLAADRSGSIVVMAGWGWADRPLGKWRGRTHVFGSDLELRRTLEFGTGRVQSVAISPDGTLIAAGGDGGIVRIYGIASGGGSPSGE